jgi:hypothetical protein
MSMLSSNPDAFINVNNGNKTDSQILTKTGQRLINRGLDVVQYDLLKLNFYWRITL